MNKAFKGCALLVVTCVSCLVVGNLYITYVFAPHKAKKYYNEMKSIPFSQGRTGVSEIVSSDIFVSRTITETLVLKNSKYMEWDGGEIHAWFFGDPVRIMLIRAKWMGVGRINDSMKIAGRPFVDEVMEDPPKEVLQEFRKMFEEEIKLHESK